MITEILFLFLLIMLNAFFAASEMALISLNDTKIKMMADDGNKQAKKLIRLLSEPSRFLATIQIGITLAGFLASALASESFADQIVALLAPLALPISEGLIKAVAVFVITMILSYFTLVMGELVPKRIAMKKAEPIAFFVVKPLMLLSHITAPFVKLLTASTNFFVRLFGIDPNAEDDNVTEEEIRMLVDVGEEKGTIHEHEKIMINNIFEFDNKTAEDIMTHRMELFTVPLSMSLPELVEAVNQEKYSRIPVYHENVDDIVGILHIKDLIPLISDTPASDFRLDEIIRKPYFVPISKKIDELFVDLKLSKTHIAVVIDEYGGTAGIITIEDLLEEIVGNIFDEYDDEEDAAIKQLDDRVYEVSGMISLDELQQSLELSLPLDDYETLSGLIISLMGKIPLPGDTTEVHYSHARFQILEVTEKRIEKVIVIIDDPDEANPAPQD